MKIRVRNSVKHYFGGKNDYKNNWKGLLQTP